jgi:hypothetical protein
METFHQNVQVILFFFFFLFKYFLNLFKIKLIIKIIYFSLKAIKKIILLIKNFIYKKKIKTDLYSLEKKKKKFFNLNNFK